MYDEDRTITMSSNPYVVTKINKKTKSKFFKNLKVGSHVVFTVPLKAAGGSTRGGSYATYVKVTDAVSGDFSYYTFNQMANILVNFELQLTTRPFK